MQDSLGALAAFSASVTWAYASGRYAELAAHAGAVRVNLLRALCASLLWGSTLLMFDGLRSLAQVGTVRCLLLAGSIACSYGFGDGLFFAAVRRLGVSSAMAMAAIYPLWAALYGALFRGEPFGPLRVLGLTLCLAGVSALSKLGRGSERTGLDHRAALAGVLLALATSLCWAGNAVLLKLGADGISIYQANTVRFSLGALMLLAQLPGARRDPLAVPKPPLKLARTLALPLLADAGLGSVCYVYGLAHTHLALGATLSSLSPLVALPMAAVRRSESLTRGRVLAVTATVAGVVLLVLG